MPTKAQLLEQLEAARSELHVARQRYEDQLFDLRVHIGLLKRACRPYFLPAHVPHTTEGTAHCPVCENAAPARLIGTGTPIVVTARPLEHKETCIFHPKNEGI